MRNFPGNAVVHDLMIAIEAAWWIRFAIMFNLSYNVTQRKLLARHRSPRLDVEEAGGESHNVVLALGTKESEMGGSALSDPHHTHTIQRIHKHQIIPRCISVRYSSSP